ncbi:unnamed protein product [Caenorhabditis nigoni]
MVDQPKSGKKAAGTTGKTNTARVMEVEGSMLAPPKIADAGSRMLMLADEPIYRCHTPSATSSTSQGWFTPLLRSMDTLSLVIVSAQTPIIQKLQGS